MIPNAFAVFRLMTSSNLTDCITGARTPRAAGACAERYPCRDPQGQRILVVAQAQR